MRTSSTRSIVSRELLQPAQQRHRNCSLEPPALRKIARNTEASKHERWRLASRIAMRPSLA
jgi:hypothetical protein